MSIYPIKNFVSIFTLKIETLRFFLIRVKINFKVIINFEVTNLDPSNKNYFIIDETKAKKKKTDASFRYYYLSQVFTARHRCQLRWIVSKV